MTVFTRYSENESKIETLLPLIVDFDITLLHSPKKFSSLEQETFENSSKENESHFVTNLRTQVFKGENVVTRVRVRPNNLNDREQLINFGNVFNIPQAIAAKTTKEDDHQKQDEELKTNCLKVLKDLFSKLYIYSYWSSTLPSPVKPSPNTFGTPIVKSPEKSEESIVEVKKFITAENEEGEISCYIFKSADVTKQTANSQSIYTLRSPIITTDNELIYEVEMEIENDMKEGRKYLIVEIFISSDQFSHTIVRTLADIAPPESTQVPVELDLLLPYATSQHYLPSKIFLCSICKPIQVTEILRITSQSRLINMKNFVQICIENLHNEHVITIEDVDLHLVGSQLLRYLSPQDSRLTLISTNLADSTSNTNNSELFFNAEQEGNFESYQKKRRDSSIAIHELFQSFVDKKCLPIMLKPYEMFRLTYVVTPSESNYTLENYMTNKPEIISTSSKKSIIALTKKKVSYIRSHNNNPSSNIVRDDSLCEYGSRVTIQYKVEADTPVRMTTKLQAKWVAVFRRGLFASMKTQSPIVKRLEPFFVTVFVTNLTERECDLVISTQLNSDDNLICQDQEVDMGTILPQDARKVNLRFVAVQEGITTINSLFCVNRRTKQNFVFPFSSQIIVTE
jgi:hypothetical protein